jgi:glycosyltransferase involved in cell wall biosynthesis
MTVSDVRALPAKPRLALIGPMLGGNPGWVTTQGEIMARLLAEDGYPVRISSTHVPRLRRIADIAASLVAWRNEVDIVIHMVFGGSAFHITDMASAICRRLRLPQIFVLRGGTLPEMAAANRSQVERVMRRADAVVSPSGFLAHYFQVASGFGLPVTVVPNTLDLTRYAYRERTSVSPRLLWMRTFHEIYRPEMAIETLADLRRSHSQATLTMAGQDAGLEEDVRALAVTRDLADAVRFPGFLDVAGKSREFADHDIYLNTNRVDNMPVSVLEAGAFGLPVIATNVGGIPFLVQDGETALLVPDGDAAAMANAVRRLAAQPELAHRLSRNGRALAESCAWPVVERQWAALFDTVLAARTAHVAEAPYA